MDRLSRRAQTLFTRPRLDDVIAGDLQDVANQLEVQRIVLDDEDPARVMTPPRSELGGLDESAHASQRVDQVVATDRLEEIDGRAQRQPPGPIVDDRGDDDRDSRRWRRPP